MNGAGGETRTHDLGIMRPASTHQIACVLLDFIQN
jgi:hypothetical protein